MAVSEQQEHFDYTNSPVVWFVRLEQARTQNDVTSIAKAKQELQRLGVDVNYRQRPTTPRTRKRKSVFSGL